MRSRILDVTDLGADVRAERAVCAAVRALVRSLRPVREWGSAYTYRFVIGFDRALTALGGLLSVGLCSRLRARLEFGDEHTPLVDALRQRFADAALKNLADVATIAVLTCHRVVKKDRSISGDRWGSKKALLAREHGATRFRLA